MESKRGGGFVVIHAGAVAGDDAVRILTVYLGAEGAKNTVERAP